MHKSIFKDHITEDEILKTFLIFVKVFSIIALISTYTKQCHSCAPTLHANP